MSCRFSGGSFWLSLLLLSSTSPLVAAGLTLPEALARTERASPDIAAQGFALQASDGRVTQAGVRPNPVLNVEAENILGTGAGGGLDHAELTLGFSQLIESRALRDQRIATARAERSTIEASGQIRRLDLLAETTRRFVALASQQEAHRITHQGVELAERTAAAVERRVAAAAAPVAERERAAVALERARMADAHAEHELEAARQDLAGSWGASEADFTEVSADVYALGRIGTLQQLLAAVEQTPDITQFLSASRLHDSTQRLAELQRRPAVEVSAGLRRLEATKDFGFVLSFRLPLPVRDLNEGKIAESRALSAGAEAQRKAALLRARAQLSRNYRELVDRAQQVTALRERALPRMENALRETEYAYERGRYGYLELSEAQRELMSLRAELIETAFQYHLVLIEIERLAGIRLAPAGEMP